MNCRLARNKVKEYLTKSKHQPKEKISNLIKKTLKHSLPMVICVEALCRNDDGCSLCLTFWQMGSNNIVAPHLSKLPVKNMTNDHWIHSLLVFGFSQLCGGGNQEFKVCG